jgi:hypothetical protein
VNERLTRLERGMAKYPTRTELAQELEVKAANEKFDSLKNEHESLSKNYEALKVFSELT